MKIQKKIGGGGGGVGSGGVGGRAEGGQAGCERRIEVFVKIQKKIGGSGWGSGWWGQGGCERRIEVFVKISKQNWGVGVGSGGVGLGWGVEVNGELKLLGKLTKQKFGGYGGGCQVRGGGGSGRWGSGSM